MSPRARVIRPVGAVTVEAFLDYLRSRRGREWSPVKLAAKANVPRSVIYRMLDGENVQYETLRRIVEAMGARILVVVDRRAP